ncbi:MAG: tRNA-dihydrouridine synthase [Patescibacteria group bacterium]|nr:tRNA-dihydrouridine synthase [Patescibacteria group bacterium]
MSSNIWKDLPKPIFTLAPMADVTDAAFRQIIAKYSRPHGPHIFYTEFVSADGLMHPVGQQKLLRELYFTPDEQPIVAQLFTSKPDKMREAAAFVAKMGFAGIDINMGCPDAGVEKQGCGADLIRHPELAQELIIAAKEGAGGLPVSVKTRIGYNKVELETWTPALLSAKPASITFHFRTRKEMSKVSAHWELADIPVKMATGSGVLILGNGDVENLAEAREKVLAHGVDGVMLGRAIYGNPWLFAETVPIPAEKLRVLVEHTKLFADLFLPGETNEKFFNDHTKSFAIMKKHFKAYADGFAGAADLRAKLMVTENSAEVEQVVQDFLQTQKLV